MGLHDEKMMKNWSNAYPDRAVVRFMHLVVFVPPQSLVWLQSLCISAIKVVLLVLKVS